MSRKLLFSCLIFLLFLSYGYALEFNFETGHLVPGKTLLIDGTADSKVTITATTGNKKIFSTKVEVTDGLFFFERKISLLDPTGEWIIEVSDANSIQEKRIKVKSSRESQFLVVSFLSPPPISFQRTNSFNLAVKITDSGKLVKDASAVFWGIEGNIIDLNNNRDGTYSANYKIPLDAKMGDFELLVIASTHSEDFGNIGGKNTVNLLIEESPISINVINPKVNQYTVGDPLNLELELTYADGTVVEGIRVLGTVNLEIVNFQEKGNGVYSASFVPKTIADEVFNISIKATDSFANGGEKNLTLNPEGYLQFSIRENAILYFFPIILLFYIFFLSFNELKYFYKINSARKRQQTIMGLKKNLHEIFYKRSLISEKTFNKRNLDLNSQLDKVELELIKLKRKTR